MALKKLFISVIIPTLNEEMYIESALKSIHEQDYKGGYEIIVADGMSKDRTLRIARKYADKVIQVKRKGVSAGRNEGAKIAKDDILIFVDGDTILLPNTLTEVAKTFTKCIVGAFCLILPFSSDLRDFALFFGYFRFVKSRIKLKKANVIGAFFPCTREAFEKVGGFNEELGVFEDFDLSERLAKIGKFDFIKNTFVITSVRRINKWGRRKATRKYISMGINHFIRKKTYSTKDYEPVR